jgi:hypothetical protein
MKGNPMTTSTPTPSSPAASPARAAANHRALSDDEILGIVTIAPNRGTSAGANRSNAPVANGANATAANSTSSAPNRGNVAHLGSRESDDPFADSPGANSAAGNSSRVNANAADDTRADSRDAPADGATNSDANSDSSANADSNADADADADANSETSADPGADPAEFRAIFEANPPLRDAWRDAQTFRELFPNAADAREIQKMFPNAEAARAAGQQLNDLARLDTLFFSNRPETHAELAAAVYRLNPAAFRNLARVMNAISSSAAASAGAPVSTNAAAAPLDPTHRVDAPPSRSQSAPEDSPDARAPQSIPADAPAQSAIAPEHAAFFHDTNAAAVHAVFDAIHTQVDRLLPEGTAPAARQRLVAEIYREVDSSLRANPAFGQQLRQAFRGAGATPENQRAIVGMVAGRARQALPGIAKKVINEWTSAIVTRSSVRSDRQRAAERRVDIASGAAANEARRSLMPRDIDYRRLSDADILNM